MKKFCVIGTPVGHSKSPELFERFSAERGLVYGKGAEYLRNEIKTKEELNRFVKELKDGEWKGCNVTMPWKTDMVGFMDEMSDTARLTGSVNTVSFRNGKLFGDSTDGRGMLNAIASRIAETENNSVDNGKKDSSAEGLLKGMHMVILGCGGAARSIIAEAVLREFGRITIVCRGGSAIGKYSYEDKSDEERTTKYHGISNNLELTIKMFEKIKKTDTFIEFVDTEDTKMISDMIDRADILINSTPLGMNTGNGDEMKLPLPEEIRFPEKLIVADCVYNPDETLLIKKAEQSGCRTVKGIRMLEEQARCGVDVLLA